MADLAPGQKLARFVLEKQLGKGAAGVVFLAKDTKLDQLVALKVIHPWLAENSEVLERFKREIVLTRRVSHPGVCRLHDLHEDDGQVFVTMEYIEGQTLASLIHREGRLSPQRTLELLRGLVPPLAAAHAAGVVHRDLKPGNILVKKDGSVAILDFGMATAEDVTRITRAGRTVGSLRFIAPEVWEGQPATPSSDLYALGVILFACIAGRLPYEASSPAEAFEAQKRGPPSMMEHSNMATPELDAVVHKAMARKPGDRYHGVEELLASFEDVVGAMIPPATPNGTNVVRPREPSNANLRTVPVVREVSARSAVRAELPASAVPHVEHVPRGALIGAAVVGVVILGAIIAAVVADGPPESKPVVDSSVDAGVAVASVGTGVDSRAPLNGEEPVNTEVVVVDGGVVAAPSGASGGGGVSVARNAVLAAMKKRGLIPGDVPALDALLARAKAMEKSKPADALAYLEKAKMVVAREGIDRGFITAKQKRLRFATERAPAGNRAKIELLEREAEKAVVTRDYAGANAKLNQAFALLR